MSILAENCDNFIVQVTNPGICALAQTPGRLISVKLYYIAYFLKWRDVEYTLAAGAADICRTPGAMQSVQPCLRQRNAAALQRVFQSIYIRWHFTFRIPCDSDTVSSENVSWFHTSTAKRTFHYIYLRC